MGSRIITARAAEATASRAFAAALTLSVALAAQFLGAYTTAMAARSLCVHTTAKAVHTR